MKKAYTSPRLSTFGSISDLTLAGLTNPGSDGVYVEVKDSYGSVCKDDAGGPVDC